MITDKEERNQGITLWTAQPLQCMVAWLFFGCLFRTRLLHGRLKQRDSSQPYHSSKITEIKIKNTEVRTLLIGYTIPQYMPIHEWKWGISDKKYFEPISDAFLLLRLAVSLHLNSVAFKIHNFKIKFKSIQFYIFLFNFNIQSPRQSLIVV